MSSWLAAICNSVGAALITVPSICKGTPLIADQTLSASAWAPAERTSSHSAKLISFGGLLFTRSAAWSAGVGGTYGLMVNPAGGSGVVAVCARSSFHPSSEPWYFTYLLWPNFVIWALP